MPVVTGAFVCSALRPTLSFRINTAMTVPRFAIADTQDQYLTILQEHGKRMMLGIGISARTLNVRLLTPRFHISIAILVIPRVIADIHERLHMISLESTKKMPADTGTFVKTTVAM